MTRQHVGHRGRACADRCGWTTEASHPDRGYDANGLRRELKSTGTKPIIPGRHNRKRVIQHDGVRYAERWRIEVMFCRLKDYRCAATRYDKLAANYLASVSFWC